MFVWLKTGPESTIKDDSDKDDNFDENSTFMYFAEAWKYKYM